MRYHSSQIKLPVSTLSGFVFCPWCACTNYIHKTKPRLSKPLLRGIIIHEFVKYMLTSPNNTYSDNATLLKLNRIIDTFRSGLSEVQADEGFLYLIQRDAIAVVRFLKNSNAHRSCEVYVDGLGVSGKIDIVEDGCPLEIKCSIAPVNGVRANHLVQLTWYALLLEYRFGIDVDYGRVLYTASPARRTIFIGDESRRWALEVRDSVESGVSFISQHIQKGGDINGQPCPR